MANNRKLQSDIDRLLKKVTEGMDVYEEVYDKFENAPSQGHKERFEGDLKKEIKKLQRLREQIKGFMSNNEVKDKKALEQSRKRIEEKMEAFKITERETKTKAFSKEGLANAAKNDANDTPQARTISWIKYSIDDAKQQIETTEFELHSDGSTIRRKRSGAVKEDPREVRLKRLKINQAKLEHLMRMVVNEEFEPEEVDEIEDQVQDFLNNDEDYEEPENIFGDLDLPEVVLKSLSTIAEDEEEEETTAALGSSGTTIKKSANPGTSAPALSASQSVAPTSPGTAALLSPQPVKKVGPTATATKSPQSGAAAGTSNVVSNTSLTGSGLISPMGGTSSADIGVSKKMAAATTAATAAAPTLTSPGSVRVAEIPPSALQSAWTQHNDSVSVITGGAQKAASGTTTTSAAAAAANTTSASAAAQGAATLLTTPPSTTTTGQSWAAAVASSTRSAAAAAAAPAASAPGKSGATPAAGAAGATSTTTSPAAGGLPEEWGAKPSTAVELEMEQDLEMDALNDDTFGDDLMPAPGGTLGDMATATNEMMMQWEKHRPPAGKGAVGSATSSPPTITTAQMTAAAAAAAPVAAAASASVQHKAAASEPLIPAMAKISAAAASGAGVASANPNSTTATTTTTTTSSSSSGTRLRDSKDTILSMLRMSFANLPHMQDVGGPRTFEPPNPLKTPSYYPQQVLPGLTSPDIYKEFELDTLFFIFYYQQRSYQQYYAAKQLKSMSYRYHKNDHTWYQRYQRPTSTTDTSETGSFLYFDYNDKWKTCRKENFTFEYEYLEDELK